MSLTSAALRAMDQAKARYEADGYSVSLEEQLLIPGGFTADAVARRGDETVVIEVRSADLSDRDRDRLDRLAQVVAAQAGWRVDIVTYQPEAPPPDPARQDVIRRVEEARQVASVSADAAVLLIWSAVEGALLLLIQQRGLGPVRTAPPRTLIHTLTIDGVLSDRQAAQLDDLALIRNDIAHGLRSYRPDPERFDWFARFALAAADDKVANVEDMIEWFFAHYVTPDDAALFYDKEEGDYFWMGTGPHDPTDVLYDQFDSALDADIDEAVGVITQQAFHWASRDELNDLKH